MISSFNALNDQRGKPMRFLRLLFLVILIGSGTIIWNTAWFQKRYFPETYLSTQIASLESKTSFLESELETMRIEYQQFKKIRNVYVEMEAQNLNRGGIPDPMARALARQIVSSKEDVLKSYISFLTDAIAANNEELEEVNRELKRGTRNPE